MFPWQQPEASPRYALLLTRLDDGINVDRAALRQAGLTRLHSVSRGDKALEIIRGQAGANPPLAVDLIICAGDLDDMSQAAFLRACAALGSVPPVLAISGNERDLAGAVAQGAAAALHRPYSLNELARALEGARARKGAPVVLEPAARSRPAVESSGASARPAAEKDRKAEKKLLQTREGLKLLRQGKPEQARDLLLGALDYDPLDLEAAMGLARLYQLGGDMEKSHRWLHRAGHICMATRQTERAEVIFSRLPEKWQGDHDLLEAQELLQEGDFDAACLAFVNICTARPGLYLHRLLGRACQFTSAPEESVRQLCAALKRAGYESTARTLAARLLAGEDGRDWEPGGFLATFPRLQEAWAVARFTAQALRASG